MHDNTLLQDEHRVQHSTMSGISVPQPCPHCGRLTPSRLGPGTVVHYARLLCASCGTFRAWHKWPRCPDGSRIPRPKHLDPQSAVEICV
jgi:hypothetical protein